MAESVLSKMFVTKARTTIIVVFTFITLIQSYVATVTMAASSAAVNTSDPLEITCTVSALSDAVVYYKEGIEVGRCAKPSIPGLPGLCVNGFSQNRTTQITTYNIISANATNDEGTWTCTHTTETSNTLGIKVYGFPTNPIDDNQAYLMNNIDTTTMDSTQLTVNVSECVNPAPTISWIFFQDCDGMSIAHIPITSTISIDADVTCSKLYSAYKSMVTVTDMKNAVGGGNYCYKVQSVVQYPGLSFQSKTVVFLQNITFTSKSKESSTDKTGTYVGSVIGGIGGVAGLAGIATLVKKKTKVKNSEEDQSTNENADNGENKDKNTGNEKQKVKKSKKNQSQKKKSGSGNKKDPDAALNGGQTATSPSNVKHDKDPDTALNGGQAAGSASNIKHDQVMYIDEQILKNNHTDDKEQKDKNSDKDSQKETNAGGAVDEDQITLLSENTS